MNWYYIKTGQVGYPQPEDDFGYIEKTYDTSNACLTCSIGLKQKDEFRFQNEPKATHSQFLGKIFSKRRRLVGLNFRNQ